MKLMSIFRRRKTMSVGKITARVLVESHEFEAALERAASRMHALQSREQLVALIDERIELGAERAQKAWERMTLESFAARDGQR